MRWTDDQVKLLERLWDDGWSATEIAAKLDIESRCAVLGKAHRLGLPGRRQETCQPPARKPKPRKPGLLSNSVARGYRPGRQLPAPRKESAVLAPSTAPAESFCCTILDLTDKTCRWPIGDPWKPEFRFCGAPGADFPAGRPYCPCHQRMAWARAAA